MVKKEVFYCRYEEENSQRYLEESRAEIGRERERENVEDWQWPEALLGNEKSRSKPET